MKRRLFLLLLLAHAGVARADEGMWLPSLIGAAQLAEMQAKGMKLSADDLYSAHRASLKDAIVRFGSGCTGELISDEGLLITNHHCGYGQVQAHSSVENDYLTHGFWARSRAEELPNPGLTATFLVRMEEVTGQVLQGVSDDMPETERSRKINENRRQIVRTATDGTWYRASVEGLYYGNQYFLFVYEEFQDIRLVGAPPSAIGKFGGDTDNWMWPRHTGDFSLFRIYADSANRPAAYTQANVPYRPKKSLTLSTKGVEEGDFTLVYGFPARTSEYLHSKAVRYVIESNPHKIRLRTLRLRHMKEAMANDPAVRIQYAAKQANVANAWKKWQGETRGLLRLQTFEKKQACEAEFARWAAGKPAYERLLPQMDSLYGALEKYAFARDYYNETVGAVELLRFAGRFSLLADTSGNRTDAEKRTELTEQSRAFFKNYSSPLDRKIFTALLNEYIAHLSDEFMPEALRQALKKHRRDVARWAAEIYEQSLFTHPEKVERLLLSDAKKQARLLANDPAYTLYRAFLEMYERRIANEYAERNAPIELLYRTYMKGQMEMQASAGTFYPDANFTLRVACGTVSGYRPADAVYYLPVSTLEGIMQKDRPDIYDYNVPPRLRELYAAKDFGPWAVNGTVPVAFLASNHTTGGNSGSPVLNGDGELIGINFDRTWESTMSDIDYDPAICRNIALDIRYALFIIDKLAGAGYLLEELKIRN
jgi:hypothetical protein